MGLHLVAAGRQPATLVGGDGDVAEVLLQLGFARCRSDLRAFGQRRADLEAACALGERLDEAVVDRVLDDYAAGSGAALAGLVEPAVRGDGHGLVEIGIGEDD